MNCTYALDPPWTQLPGHWYDAILCLIIIMGIVGNSLVIYVQTRASELRVGGTTATHRFIIHLAVTDLLTGVFLIPVPEFVNVPRTAAGKFYCHFLESDAKVFLFYIASVYTLTTISIERYLAVVHPYSYKVLMLKDRSKYYFLVIWICSVATHLHQFIFHEIDECGRCRSSFPSERSRRVNGVFLFLTQYVGPLLVMTYTSLHAIFALRREMANDRTTSSNSGQVRQLKRLRRRFTTMFIVIFASLMLLWTPDQVGYLLYNLKVVDRSYSDSVVNYVFVSIALLNATVTNPIIYTLCLPQFRRAVMDLRRCQHRNAEYRSHHKPTTDTTLSSV